MTAASSKKPRVLTEEQQIDLAYDLPGSFHPFRFWLVFFFLGGQTLGQATKEGQRCS